MMEMNKREQKTMTVCTKPFKLHGREYKVGEMITYKEANQLTTLLEELELIAPTPLETN